MYLIYVISRGSGISELTSSQITSTFAATFRELGELKNVKRDLGGRKQKAEVAENTTVAPTTWYLTLAGEKIVEELISKAKS